MHVQMAITVGINGFGRIGRIILRTCLQNSDFAVTAINDPAIDAEYICYLIKFDSTHGKFKGNITKYGDDIKVDDNTVKIFHEKLPSNIPWQVAGVQYVVEASGMFTTLEKASGHLASEGVKRVLVMAPSVDVPMIILGVNEDKLKPEQKVMSCASSTLYCLAPIIKLLEDHFGVAEGFITSIHAMTPSLKPLDGLCLRGKHWRDHRSIHQNMIPASTGACKALGRIIPQVKDKMIGLAFRVPIVNVSVLDITVRLNINTSLEEIMKNVEKASKFRMRNIIKISCEEAVSSDFISDSHSCILDFNSSLQLKPNFFKLICWYENEYSYACRVINSITFSETQLSTYHLPSSKLTYVRPRMLRKQDALLQTEYSSRDCSSEANPKVLRSVSQDAGIRTKPPKSAILRKPFLSCNTGTTKPLSARDPKTRNEIFKIWNDHPNTKCQPAVPKPKQNRSSFFQSCVYIAQNVENTECMKAHERLETVKREFSKMVNITENLLKKSCSNKMQLISECTVVKDEINKNLNKDETDVRDDERNNTIPYLCYDNKRYKNNSSNSVMTDDNCKRESISNHLYNLNNSDYSSVSTKASNSKINRTLTDTDNILLKLHEENQFYESNADTNHLSQKRERIKEKAVFKEQLAKSINTFMGGLSQNIQVQYALTHNIGFPGKFKHNPDDKVISHAKKNSDHVNPQFNNGAGSTKVPDRNNVKRVNDDNECNDRVTKEHLLNKKESISEYLEKKSSNTCMMDEVLKKHNVVLVDYNRDVIEIAQDRDVNSKVLEVKGLKDLTTKTLKELSRFDPEPIVIISQEASTCVSPDTETTAAFSNADENRLKQDIYDKLDSISATDSTDSMEFKERKSQVLQISDVTGSNEDLARLDKICRIIEISDELSDQLFSALDHDATTLETKNWSFKDLCERIKLDEFCNKVFDKRIG